MKKHYIVVDEDDAEVNFYDEEFPNARNRAIQCAKQVEGGIVIALYSGGVIDNPTDEIVLTPYDEEKPAT